MASENTAGKTNAVFSSPPSDSSRTCSPGEGAHQLRVRPARCVIHGSQAVTLLPVVTRQRAFGRSSKDAVSEGWATIEDRPLTDGTTNVSGLHGPAADQFSVEVNLARQRDVLRQRRLG